jgi:hypothetical protein
VSRSGGNDSYSLEVKFEPSNFLEKLSYLQVATSLIVEELMKLN